ncbi:cysteine desulfurase NifS [soil metagenome]
MTYGRDGIYLDHAATTPTDLSVIEVMLPYFTGKFGNPSSIYQLGQEGRAALDRARSHVSGVLGCRQAEVLFTSGATESNNLALRGAVEAWRGRRPAGEPPHLIISAIEHHAVLDVADHLATTGVEIDVVACDDQGIIDPVAVRTAVRPNTALISVMYANNEIGSVQPIRDIAAVGKERGIPVHTDAVQAAGMLDLDVGNLGVDLLSLSAHKFYGPKGVGALYVKKGTPITYQQRGGGQESGRRGGTENVPLIVGLAEALRLADASRPAYVQHCQAVRDRLWNALSREIPGMELNGPPTGEFRLPNNLNVVVPGVQGETMLLNLDLLGVAASAGSACTTGNSAPSHVLLAIGRSDAEARASIRLSIGRGNSAEEIDAAAEAFIDSVNRIQQLSAV